MGDDVCREAADMLDGPAGCVIPVDYRVEGGIAMRPGLGVNGDIDAGGQGVDESHGFVAAAGGEDVHDFGDGALGLDADGGAEAEAVGFLFLPLGEFNGRHVAPGIDDAGAPFVLLPGSVGLEAGGDGLGDFEALFGSETGLGEGRAMGADHDGFLGVGDGQDGAVNRIASMMRRPATRGWE